VVTHRQQSTKIGNRSNVGGGGNSKGVTVATTIMATMTATMTTTMTAAAAAAGGQWQMLTLWCGAGIRRPEAAEMGIKQKWKQCGYDRLKFLISKIVTWVYFYSYPTAFPIY
jgi:hypothetical protein